MRLIHTVCLFVVALCGVGASKRQRSKAGLTKRLDVHSSEMPRKGHAKKSVPRRCSRRATTKTTHSRRKLEKRRRKKNSSRRSGESTLPFSDEGSDDGIFEEFRPTTFNVSGFNSVETSSDLEQAEKTISGNDDYVQNVENVSLRDPVHKWPVTPIVSILRSTTGKRRFQSNYSAKKVTFAPKVEIMPSYIGRRSKVRKMRKVSATRNKRQ